MTVSVIPLARFLPEVRAQAPGVLALQAQDAILRAVQNYCRNGWAWEEAADDLDIVADVSDYDLEPWPDTHVLALFLYYKGRRLLPLNARDLAHAESRAGIRRGSPAGYLRLGNASVRLDRVPAADEARALKIVTFLQPTEDCEEVPEDFWHLHREGVVAGALAHLLAQDGMPWHNPTAQVRYANTHAAAVETARIHVFRKYSDAESRATGRRII